MTTNTPAGAKTPRIPWVGGECPVHPEALVCAEMRTGSIVSCAHSEDLDWKHDSDHWDIVAFWVISSPDPDDIARYQSESRPSVEAKSRTLRVRAAVGLYKLDTWQAVVCGYEVQSDDSQDVVDGEARNDASASAAQIAGMDVSHWRWIEADIPLPDEDEPVVEGEVSDG